MCSKAIKAVSLDGTHMHMLGRRFLQRRQLNCWVWCGLGWGAEFGASYSLSAGEVVLLVCGEG